MADSQACRVYVGNIDWKISWQELKDHMKSAGEVAFADILEEWDGRSKGAGIVEFKNQEGAQNAIATLNDSKLGERLIFVREDRESSRTKGGYKGGFKGGWKGDWKGKGKGKGEWEKDRYDYDYRYDPHAVPPPAAAPVADQPPGRQHPEPHHPVREGKGYGKDKDKDKDKLDRDYSRDNRW
mmetsp:Transcript_2157/g.5677  ORF Transcript_2157/g.5677 Transcript_2157/m.5677 type:complete len:182 (+) Transcript_2157:120-665(+)